MISIITKYQFCFDRQMRFYPVRDTWALAAQDAVNAGHGRWTKDENLILNSSAGARIELHQVAVEDLTQGETAEVLHAVQSRIALLQHAQGSDEVKKRQTLVLAADKLRQTLK